MTTLSRDITPPEFNDPKLQTIYRMLRVAETREGEFRVNQLKAIVTALESLIKTESKSP